MSPNRLSPTFLQHSRSTKNTNLTQQPQQPQQPSALSSFTMDKNLETEPQPVAAEAPTTPEPQPPIAAPSQTDSVADVPTSPDSSITAPSVSSTEPSETSEPSRTDGPLSSLAQKAVETQLGRAASQKVPESARPTLHRASRVLNTVDEHLLAAKDTLDTDEGRRVVKSACEFASSLIAFFAMLFTTAVSSAERRLGMQPTEETLPTRFVKVCREATNRAKTCAETREKQVDGSCEARVYAHARQAVDIMCSAFKSCLKGMSDFKGPGNEYVSPAAEKIISILPEDMQVSVRQSPGPLKSLRNGLGFEPDTCSASQEGRTAATNVTHDEGTRMKVD